MRTPAKVIFVCPEQRKFLSEFNDAIWTCAHRLQVEGSKQYLIHTDSIQEMLRQDTDRRIFEERQVHVVQERNPHAPLALALCFHVTPNVNRKRHTVLPAYVVPEMEHKRSTLRVYLPTRC